MLYDIEIKQEALASDTTMMVYIPQWWQSNTHQRDVQ